jgi:DnaK suppressor protein
MAEKNHRSKSGASNPAKTINLEDKINGARKMLWEMKKDLLAEGFEKSLPESLEASLNIGDEGDRAGNEGMRDVSILLSARNKEKLLAIEEALQKIREGTYGTCAECVEEIGAGRLKVMPLAQLCVTCQAKIEKETEHQKFARDEMRDQELISEAAEVEKD